MKTKIETFNPSLTRHFAIALRAFNAAQAFGAPLMRTVTNELNDYGIEITERAYWDFQHEVYSKQCLLQKGLSND